MKAAPFVILAIVLSCCAPKPPGPGLKSPEQQPVSAAKQPPKGKIVPVEIVVGPMTKLLEVCKTGNKSVHTIYVATPSRRVHHCMGVLVTHADHGPGSPLSKADVPLSAGDQVRWFSTTHTFYVASVVKGKEGPQSPAAPATPFGVAAFTNTPASEVTSPPVPFINGKSVQRYKVTFNITDLGNVDPDLICTM